MNNTASEGAPAGQWTFTVVLMFCYGCCYVLCISTQTTKCTNVINQISSVLESVWRQANNKNHICCIIITQLTTMPSKAAALYRYVPQSIKLQLVQTSIWHTTSATSRVGQHWSNREVRKTRPKQPVCTNMSAFVSERCRVNRKPWRKLWCGDDNRALSVIKLINRACSLVTHPYTRHSNSQTSEC